VNSLINSAWLKGDNKHLSGLAEFFSVFADPTRLRILFLLLNKDMCVGRIARELELEQSTVSYQLKILRHLKLVRAKREGKNMRYSIDDDHIKEILKLGVAHLLE